MINLPYKILIEKSVRDKVEEALLEMNLGKRCAMICASDIQNIIGNAIRDEISNSFAVELIEPESTEKSYLEDLSKRISSFDFTIGIGGGKVMDITKYSSFLAKRPWIAFPTVLSHDGVVSSRASLDHDGKKISVDAIEPMAIIADLDTIRNAPYRWIAAGAGDLVANISSVEDWRIAAKAGEERYHTLMAELSLLSARGVINHIGEIKERSYHGLEILLWSLICSGFAMNIYGSSRPCSGSEHNFSHALDELGAGALHGEQCALGTVIMTYLQDRDWNGMREILIKLGLPTNTEDLGVNKDLMIKALVMARGVRDRYTILNERDITEESATEILKRLEII